MRIVVNGKEANNLLWGSPQPVNTNYRLMKYLVQEDCDEGLLILNLVTGELVLLDNEEALMINNLPSPYFSKMDELISHHYLVPETFDEAKSTDELRALLKKLNSNTSHTQKGVKLSVYNSLGIKNTIMPPTTAPRRPLMALSDSMAGCL